MSKLIRNELLLKKFSISLSTKQNKCGLYLIKRYYSLSTNYYSTIGIVDDYQTLFIIFYTEINKIIKYLLILFIKIIESYKQLQNSILRDYSI